eukprot:scaffold4208_cov116-Skeletonema_dohrnii-CCMP3373.AAC.1
MRGAMCVRSASAVRPGRTAGVSKSPLRVFSHGKFGPRFYVCRSTYLCSSSKYVCMKVCRVVLISSDIVRACTEQQELCVPFITFSASKPSGRSIASMRSMPSEPSGRSITSQQSHQVDPFQPSHHDVLE